MGKKELDEENQGRKYFKGHVNVRRGSLRDKKDFSNGEETHDLPGAQPLSWWRDYLQYRGLRHVRL